MSKTTSARMERAQRFRKLKSSWKISDKVLLVREMYQYPEVRNVTRKVCKYGSIALIAAASIYVYITRRIKANDAHGMYLAELEYQRLVKSQQRET